MDSSSVCVRKLEKKWWRKTQEITLNTLDKTSFMIWKWSSKTWGYIIWKEWEKLAQNYSWNLRENSPQMSHFIELEKLAVGPVRPVGRPPGRPANGHISDRCAIGRPVGRPRPGYREHCSLSGRPGPFQRAELSRRSTGSIDRPSYQNRRARRSTARSTDFRTRSTGRSTAEAWKLKFRDLKLGLFSWNKIP